MFRCIAAITAGLAIAFSASAQGAEVPRYTIEQFLDTTNFSGASFSPDGTKLLVTSNANGIYNAYAYPVDGGEPTALTASEDDSVFGVSYFPDDERILYTADQGGNELNHLYVREVDGTVKDLTPGEGLKASFAGWADDDQSFFVVTNERDPQFFDLYEYQVNGYARELIYENKDGYFVSAVSPDKQRIALTKIITRAKSDVYIYDRDSGETEQLTQHAGDVVCRPQHFTKDGTSLRCLTDKGHEFLYLVNENLQSGERELLEKVDWDIAYAERSKSGRYLALGINEDARTVLRVFDTETGEELNLPDMPGLSVVSISLSNDEDAIAFYVQSGRIPRDLYYLSLEDGANPVRLTRSLNKAIEPEHLVEPEVVRFKSFDGVEVPGILYKPYGASAENKRPALVYVHGGPGGQTRVSYTAQIQYLVNHGYVVYGINNRGSSGYGKTFFAMDDLKHGDEDLDDCVASKQMLIDTGYVDPERIGIMGGSYGGYMVCAALAFRPEAFAVGVDIFGVTNWVRTLKSIPPWWTAQRDALYKELGDPNTQEDYLRKISPLFHAKNIVKPMIVLQGKNDPRVLQVESDEMVEAVRSNGVPVEYVVFDDEGHGFRKKENQIKGYKAVLEFLNEHL
jgi:dipeptidyl aminopeptidase/acylaminoacyl peptidase